MASTKKLTIVTKIYIDSDLIGTHINNDWDSHEEELGSERRAYEKEVALQEQLAEDEKTH